MKKRLAAVTILGLVVAACGGGEAATTTNSAGEADTAGVALGSTPLGSVLVDGAGMTLYLFTPDAQGTPTCEDDCAAIWPPMVGAASAGAGVDEALLGTVVRADGAEQTTYNGWPLYHFTQDGAPGDTLGQGRQDAWFAVNASGEAITTPAARDPNY